MRSPIQRAGFAAVVTVMAVAAAGTVKAEGTWRGLTVTPEHRCSAYDRSEYPYSQSVETRIIKGMGGRVYGPYTGRHFGSPRETDIEHMVATSEAHDSGLCAADAATKRRFAGDLLNLGACAAERFRKALVGTGPRKCSRSRFRWRFVPNLDPCSSSMWGKFPPNFSTAQAPREGLI